MSLKKGYLRRQFGLFGWVHMSLMLIVVSRLVILHRTVRVSSDRHKPFYHQQHSRGPHMALGSRLSGHLQ